MANVHVAGGSSARRSIQGRHLREDLQEVSPSILSHSVLHEPTQTLFTFTAHPVIAILNGSYALSQRVAVNLSVAHSNEGRTEYGRPIAEGVPLAAGESR